MVEFGIQNNHDTDEHGQKSGIPIKMSMFFRIFRNARGSLILLRKADC
jgi:hypothetical protein